jgi:hypothetical protein
MGDISKGLADPLTPPKKQREAEKVLAFLALLAGAHKYICLERENSGMSLLLCPGKMFRKEN